MRLQGWPPPRTPRSARCHPRSRCAGRAARPPRRRSSHAVLDEAGSPRRSLLPQRLRRRPESASFSSLLLAARADHPSQWRHGGTGRFCSSMIELPLSRLSRRPTYASGRRSDRRDRARRDDELLREHYRAARRLVSTTRARLPRDCYPNTSAPQRDAERLGASYRSDRRCGQAARLAVRTVPASSHDAIARPCMARRRFQVVTRPSTMTWRSWSREVTLSHDENERLDPAGVAAKFCVPPDRIADDLALIGDLSTLPGVDKVGRAAALDRGTAPWRRDRQRARGQGVVVDTPGRRRLAAAGRRLVTVRRCDLPPRPRLARVRRLDSLRDRRSRLLAFYASTAASAQALDTARGLRAAPRPVRPRLRPSRRERRPVPQDTIVKRYDTGPRCRRSTPVARIGPRVTASTSRLTRPTRAATLIASALVTPGEAAYIPLRHDYAVRPNTAAAGVPARLRPWLEKAGRPRSAQRQFGQPRLSPDRFAVAAGGTTPARSYVLSRKAPSLETCLSPFGRTALPTRRLRQGAGQIPFAQFRSSGDRVRGRTPRWRCTCPPPRAAGRGRAGLPTSTADRDAGVGGAGADRGTGVLIYSSCCRREPALSGGMLASIARRSRSRPAVHLAPKQIGEILFGKARLPVAARPALFAVADRRCWPS